MLKALVVVIPTVLAIYCLVQVAQSRPDDVRTLPRWGWALAILALPVLGAVGWLVLGRPKRGTPGQRRPKIVAPDDDPDFLRGIRFRKPTDRPDDQN